jgi:hypothetical protein
MIHFNRLFIDPVANKLVVDVSVLNDAYYKDVYLNKIYIDTQDTYIDTGPSSQAKEFIIEDTVSSLSGKSVGQKTVVKEFDSADIGTMDNMFFVYVYVKGYPAPNTPCGGDNCYTLGVAVNMQPFYNQAMGYIKDLSDSCNISKDFIDYILKLRGLELAVKTCNYIEAIEYFKKFFKNRKTSNKKSGGCGCGNYR